MKSVAVVLLAISALNSLKCCSSQTIQPPPGTFIYYAYGSNMFTSRMHINCNTSKYVDIAELKGWRLDFQLHVSYWNGSVATITQDTNSSVWGVVWQIDNSQMEKLDKQEMVDSGLYYATNVTVITPSGSGLLARVYIMPQPLERLLQTKPPSRTYQRVVFLGAIEHRLPACYVATIDNFNDNGNIASSEIRTKLGYPFCGTNN